MKWITREHPKIDRVACPWLIRRFIDESPEFLFVPADQVTEISKHEDATPYDVPGARLSHVGERCSFDAFLSQCDGSPARRPEASSPECKKDLFPASLQTAR